MTLCRREEGLGLTITDTGEGIDAAFLPHVFDMFRQAEPAGTRRHGGLGLGLSIVKRLIELHGGTVRASSAGPGVAPRSTSTIPGAGSATATSSIQDVAPG